MGRGLVRRVERLETEARQRSSAGRRRTSATTRAVQQATRDCFTWVTRHTKTYNEHWRDEGRPSAYEPFPAYPYLAVVLATIDQERITWWEKSRDMMLSWACVSYLTLHAMMVPERSVLFQTQTEKKAAQLVKYAKCLYRQQPGWLRDAFPITKEVDAQPDLELHFKNGSSIVGIPGGADQIRSYHPWGYLNDESSFQPEAGECYNEALSVVRGKIIFNSSAAPGWYSEARRDIVRSEEQ